MITPREMLRDYMTVLNILWQNPQAKFEDVVGSAVTLKTPEQLEEEKEAERAIEPPKDEAGRRFTIDEIEF